jgi:hypothetical protein
MQDGDVYGSRMLIYPNDAQVGDVLYVIMQDIEARLRPQ